MIDGPPQVVGDTVDLYENLVEVPPPVGQGAHAVDPLASNLGGKHRAKSVPPEPHGFMADLDAALMQEVLDVAQRQRVADLQHHRQADDFWAGLEVTERGALVHLFRLDDGPAGLKQSSSDSACRGCRHRPDGACHPCCDPPPSSAAPIRVTAILTQPERKRHDKSVSHAEKRPKRPRAPPPLDLSRPEPRVCPRPRVIWRGIVRLN